MSIVRWNPLVSRMLAQWPDQWDEDIFPLSMPTNNGLEVYETEKEVVVKANVAGVKEDQIDLTFEKGILLITAENEEEKTDEQRTHYSKNSWEYSYKVSVPGLLDHNEEPNAELKGGVLTVRFAKSKASLPKKLKVSSALEEK